MISIAYPVVVASFERYLFILMASAVVFLLLYCSLWLSWSWLLLFSWLGWLFAVVGWLWQQWKFEAFYLVYQEGNWYYQPQCATQEKYLINSLKVIVDAQQLILVKVRLNQYGKLNARWFWLRQRHSPQHWHLLRCAIFQTNY